MLIALLLFAPAPALAQASGGELTACVARQLPADTPEAMFAQAGRFDCEIKQAALGPGSYWVRLAIPSSLAPVADPVLLFSPNMQRNASLFTSTAKGTSQTTLLSNDELSRRARFGGRVAVELDPGVLARGALLLKIDGAMNATGLLNHPRLVSKEHSHRLEIGELAIIAAFGGLGLALLVYNLVLWVTIRERFLLVYCGTVLAMLAYVGSHSGVLDIAFPAIGAEWRFRLNYLALGTMAVLALRFIAVFLPDTALPRWLRLVLNVNYALILLASLSVAMASAEWLNLFDRIFMITFVPVPLLGLMMGVYGWQHDRASVRVLVLAWSFPVIMVIVRLLHAANVIPFSNIVEHSVIFAMSSEALLSSLAMALRVRRIAGERDHALAEELVSRRLSEIDPLTGLQNRRALLANAQEMAPGEPLRMLLVDIDFFKLINDSHGHSVGDEVLQEVAAILARRLEIQGTAARLGGEEFALLGPARDLPDDLPLALLADIRNAEMPAGVRITVSIGVAEGPVDCEADWRDLYRRTDAALYKAKNSGRNCHAHGRTRDDARDDASLAGEVIAAA